MGRRYSRWRGLSQQVPQNYAEVVHLVQKNRHFQPVKQLEYGDYGLLEAVEALTYAIKNNQKIALYADYDVDGTMSCTSWIWFFQSIGFTNYTYYIPDRFSEGYGVNLKAVQHLVLEKKADLIITMDTGITANAEASWCKEQGVVFICTDHHKIQPEKLPDSIILNPKTHPDEAYQELCGCGITFVLLRKLGAIFQPPAEVWLDLLALAGMATICDLVPLNGVNHQLAQKGVQAISKSKRPIFKELLQSALVQSGSFNETDVGFRIGPRINAVGRLDHAHKVIAAFIEDDFAPLVGLMHNLNEQRKQIQQQIVIEATEQAAQCANDPILLLGGDWHQGVVGIAASHIADRFWKPTFLFQKQANGICKGSARSIPDFDVTDAMMFAQESFLKFGGHKAAGGFSFALENHQKLKNSLQSYASSMREKNPDLWVSQFEYDFELPVELLKLELDDHLRSLRPFGHKFSEPLFLIRACASQINFYKDKQTLKPKHTAITLAGQNSSMKVLFFNDVIEDIPLGKEIHFLVSVSKNEFRGRTSLSLIGKDLEY